MYLLLDINKEELMNLMKSFYTLSHIRISVVNTNCEEVIGYPEKFTDFCTCLRQNPSSCLNCISSDSHGFSHCAETAEVYIYKCHAGLTEAAYPLRENETTIGYIMFGQVTDIKDRSKRTKYILGQCKEYGLDQAKLQNAVRKLRYKSHKELKAAVTIFETCIQYILQKQLISRRNEQLITKLNQYIHDHISGSITVEDITKHLLISRTNLYILAQKHLGTGVAQYIRNYRIGIAKEHLAAGIIPYHQVHESVGFNDYQYFKRVFKRYVKKTPRQFQKSAGAESTASILARP